MKRQDLSRRDLFKTGGVAFAGLALLNSPWFAGAASSQPGDEVLPWLDQRAENPVPEVIANQQTWEELDAWITPNDQFFSIAHFDRPEIDADEWQLEITGRVGNPLTLTLDDLKARTRQRPCWNWKSRSNSSQIVSAGCTALPKPPKRRATWRRPVLSMKNCWRWVPTQTANARSWQRPRRFLSSNAWTWQ